MPKDILSDLLQLLSEWYLHLLHHQHADGEKAGTPVVAADAVGAGVGEMILYATGSSARQTVATQNRPVDAVVMAIVDHWEVGGEIKYRKSDDA